jgi:hypothetical protein
MLEKNEASNKYKLNFFIIDLFTKRYKSLERGVDKIEWKERRNCYGTRIFKLIKKLQACV